MSDPCRDGNCDICDADPPEVPPCCAAMKAAVVDTYNATWKRNLELIAADHYARGYADAEAGRPRRRW